MPRLEIGTSNGYGIGYLAIVAAAAALLCGDDRYLPRYLEGRCHLLLLVFNPGLIKYLLLTVLITHLFG